MWSWNFCISAYSFRFRWCVREWLGVYFDWGSDAASLHYSDHSHKPFPHSNGTFWYIDTPEHFHTACQSVVVQCSSIQFQCVQIATAVKPDLLHWHCNEPIYTSWQQWSPLSGQQQQHSTLSQQKTLLKEAADIQSMALQMHWHGVIWHLLVGYNPKNVDGFWQIWDWKVNPIWKIFSD